MDDHEDTGKAEKDRTAFVVSLPLQTEPHLDRLLADRFLVAQRLYNTLLNDGFVVVRRLRRHDAWRAAQALSKKDKEHRADLFGQARKAVGFSQHDFEKRLNAHSTAAGFGKRLGSNERQKVALTVFQALDAWVCRRKGKPNFKSSRNPLSSIEDKSPKGPLQAAFDENGMPTGVWLGKSTKRLVLVKDMTKELRKNAWLAEALQAETRYARISRRTIKGHARYFLQLVLAGCAPIKEKHRLAFEQAGAKAGIDVGLRHVAVFGETSCDLLETRTPRADALDRNADLLQRKIDRQRRANNPDFYAPDFKDGKGRKKKGNIKSRSSRKGKSWTISKSMRKNLDRLAEIRRIAAAERRQTVGRNANAVLSFGKTILHDGVSPKALQRRWGKSVSRTCPGLLMSELAKKAKRLGGEVVKVDILALKSSQYDHTTNTFTKKTLSQRIHTFGDGSGWMQRDLYSALLHFCAEGSTHRQEAIRNRLDRIDSPVHAGRWEFHPSAKDRPEDAFPAVHGNSPSERSRCNTQAHEVSTVDALRTDALHETCNPEESRNLLPSGEKEVKRGVSLSDKPYASPLKIVPVRENHPESSGAFGRLRVSVP